MGRQIVYCEGCGNSLREDDFEKRRARIIDKRPFCTECRPFKEEESEPSRRRSSSDRIAAPPASPRKTSTGHIPILPAPARRSTSRPASNPLPVLAGVGGLVFIFLIYAVTQSGSKQPSVTAPPAPTPVIELPTPAPPQPSPPPPVDPPPPVAPPRRQVAAPDPPTRSEPLVAPSAAEKFDAFLIQIRQMIESDVRHERMEEVLNMFRVARNNAGARRAEVEKLKSDYLSSLDEPLRRAAVWAEWKISSASEPGKTGILQSYQDRENVYVTQPPDASTPARFERDVEVPSGKKTSLTLWVSPGPSGAFDLRIFADGKSVLEQVIGASGSGWQKQSVDLTPFAGRRIALRLEESPHDRSLQQAYWSDVSITSE